jgi:hypothetical protein
MIRRRRIVLTGPQNSSSPVLNLTGILSDPSRNLTVLLPPSAALQAVASNSLINALNVNVSATQQVPLLDALLLYHIVPSAYSAAQIRSAITQGATPGNSTGGLGVPTLLSGVNAPLYGYFSSASGAASASSSASASASAAQPSSSSGSADYIFVVRMLASACQACSDDIAEQRHGHPPERHDGRQLLRALASSLLEGPR